MALNAVEALERLKAGNLRFVNRTPEADSPMSHAEREELLKGQEPLAVVLGCSDSRVPVEHVFDQGPGDLFVVRVAGNVVGRQQLGSIEFAVTELGTRLVVVLGHSRCGAVAAAIDKIRNPTRRITPHLRTIIDPVRSAIEGLVEEEFPSDDALLREAVRTNVRASLQRIRNDPGALKRFLNDGGLAIVGAKYSLATGTVEFFDNPPPSP